MYKTSVQNVNEVAGPRCITQGPHSGAILHEIDVLLEAVHSSYLRLRERNQFTSEGSDDFAIALT